MKQHFKVVGQPWNRMAMNEVQHLLIIMADIAQFTLCEPESRIMETAAFKGAKVPMATLHAGHSTSSSKHPTSAAASYTPPPVSVTAPSSQSTKTSSRCETLHPVAPPCPHLERATDDRRQGKPSSRDGTHKSGRNPGGSKGGADSRTEAAVIHSNADIEEAVQIAFFVGDSDVDVADALPLISVVYILACQNYVSVTRERKGSSAAW